MNTFKQIANEYFKINSQWILSKKYHWSRSCSVTSSRALSLSVSCCPSSWSCAADPAAALGVDWIPVLCWVLVSTKSERLRLMEDDGLPNRPFMPEPYNAEGLAPAHAAGSHPVAIWEVGVCCIPLSLPCKHMRWKLYEKEPKVELLQIEPLQMGH